MELRSLVLLALVSRQAIASAAADEQLRQLHDIKEHVVNERRARNIIFFVGDGMGLSTLTAARVFKGQVHGGRCGSGEEGHLFFERFPNVALVKTYSSDRVVSDSSAAASAIFTGVKCRNAVLGFDHTALGNKSCGLSVGNRRLLSLFDLAQAAGKATGIVTNTRITHATPAALYAATVNRNWEDDSQVHASERTCQKDIARQLIEETPGRNVDVLLGGGLRHFRPLSLGGRRTDRRDLVAEWRKTHDGAFVRNRRELRDASASRRRPLLGLFAESHLDYAVDRTKERVNVSEFRVREEDSEQPTLTEMLRAALQVLRSDDDDGFVLLVEGGRIDHAHHDSTWR